MTTVKNSKESLNKRVNQAEKGINKIEDKLFEIIYPEKQKENEWKSEVRLWELGTSIKRNNICIMGIPEEEKENESLFKQWLKTSQIWDEK